MDWEEKYGLEKSLKEDIQAYGTNKYFRESAVKRYYELGFISENIFNRIMKHEELEFNFNTSKLYKKLYELEDREDG